MGIILRNCIRNKTKPLTTKLAKALPVHPKLFHVEQFASRFSTHTVTDLPINLRDPTHRVTRPNLFPSK